MSEVLMTYEAMIIADDGTGYHVRACGRRYRENLWEGWLEFIPTDGSPVLRSRRETTQPERDDLEYWASGLERVYLEGALRRALEPERPVIVTELPERPAYDAPHPHAPQRNEPGRRARPLLDPFEIRATKGEESLRQQLDALESWQVATIIRVHELSDRSLEELETLPRQDLVGIVMERLSS